ncbi:MAG TPA: DUF1559 domain-containing protein, partial [Pirellulaceae bacterium]|nr:DUF1559 domain-containing protein [Pirellulaceae bacterium]
MFKVANHRNGFTLIELLVVMGVISILAGLLLPAVQSTRRAARQTQCLNNLRQGALASLNYESAHRHFPSNGWGLRWLGIQGSVPGGLGQPGSWVFNVLPFLEQDAVNDLAPQWHQLPGTSAQWSDYANVTLPVLRCPQRSGADIVEADPARAGAVAVGLHRRAA